MSKKDDGSGKVKETRTPYRVLQRVRNRKAMKEAARRMDAIRERHAHDKGDGKDVVTLLRELRDR